MTIAIITHSDCKLHKISADHPERPERVEVIDNALSKSNLVYCLKYYSAPLVTEAQLKRVHDADYVDFIFQIAPKDETIPLDLDTAMNPYTLPAALRAAGAVVQGVDLVMSQEVAAVFCNVRPPGHHAERDKAMGFCIFNNLAVGVAHALVEYQLQRIAIIDFDVHHGNGTENIFLKEKRVLQCSSFQSPFYPFTGTETKSDHILNLPLPAGTKGKIFREQAEQLWLNPLQQFKPELIFVSAGFDAYKDDQLAMLQLDEKDYMWLGQMIKQVADRYSKGRVVSVLEGGYALDSLGDCVVSYLTPFSLTCLQNKMRS